MSKPLTGWKQVYDYIIRVCDANNLIFPYTEHSAKNKIFSDIIADVDFGLGCRKVFKQETIDEWLKSVYPELRLRGLKQNQER